VPDFRTIRVQALYDGAGRFISPCEIFIRDGKLERIFSPRDDSVDAEAFRREYAPVADQIHEPYGFALPGLVNSHHHSYSALARGMPLLVPPGDLKTILKDLWWKFDSKLDLEDIYVSALVTAVEAIHAGCTLVVDHHSSPFSARGSLRQIENAFEETGIKSVLCLELSDRNGDHVLEQELEESLTFAKAHVNNHNIRAMMGLHAGFTLSDRTLKKIAARKPGDLPIHFHAGEHQLDLDDAKNKGYAGPIQRLSNFGLLNSNSIAAHCIHLSEQDMQVMADYGVKIAHCPESNMNNGVGYPSIQDFSAESVVLGTDGMGSSMLTSARAAFLLSRAARDARDPDMDSAGLVRAMLLDNPSSFLSSLFGRKMGVIKEGEPADFVIFDYRPFTPINQENWFGHVLFGMAQNPRADWVYSNGRAILANGRITSVDEASVLKEAREHAKRIWPKVLKHGGD